VQVWHSLTIDPAGIRYVSDDEQAGATLAALPGKSVLSVETEAGLLASGIRPLRNAHGLIVAIVLRDGSVFDYVPDAHPAEPTNEQSEGDQQ
jgi:hypothetical protein